VEQCSLPSGVVAVAVRQPLYAAVAVRQPLFVAVRLAVAAE